MSIQFAIRNNVILCESCYHSLAMYLSVLLVVLYQLSGIQGELEITVLPDSYCLLQVDNETDKESFVIVNETKIDKIPALTVHGNLFRSCDLQINGSSSSQHAQVEISIVAGNMTGSDYIYVERIKQIKCVLISL